MLVGAGTILNTETAAKCIDAGAGFLTSPGLNPKVVEFAAKKDIAVLPGPLAPTEVIQAWEAGADFVKAFPCAEVGGERYIKALKTDRRRRRKPTNSVQLQFWRELRPSASGAT